MDNDLSQSFTPPSGGELEHHADPVSFRVPHLRSSITVSFYVPINTV